MVKKILASHILVKTESEANVACYDVSHGKDFGEVAKAVSICPSKKKSGNLGWFSRGKMVKEFEKVAFSLKKGEISEPFKTQFGWHIVKVMDTQ
ncbi:peptidyl-prolyl cis-trans isomerase [Candidatus Woesearchaeota archaeon]|nr:peptidyl-prolyl cis-trans isomerase [Candidatus Woesearchaeota archaeon]